MEFASLRSRHRGRLYALSADWGDATIWMKIHTPALDHVQNRIDIRFENEANEFERNLRVGFGLNGALRARGEIDGYLYLAAELHWGDEDPIAIALMQLLGILNSVIERDGFDSDQDLYQHLMVALSASRDPAPMEAVVSASIVDWLESKTSAELLPVRRAMFYAKSALSERVLIPQKTSPNEFYPMEILLKDDGWFALVAGGASLDVIEERHIDGCGFRLTSHNVDSAYQQLIILMGLAALYELASKDLDTGPLF